MDCDPSSASKFRLGLLGRYAVVAAGRSVLNRLGVEGSRIWNRPLSRSLRARSCALL